MLISSSSLPFTPCTPSYCNCILCFMNKIITQPQTPRIVNLFFRLQLQLHDTIKYVCVGQLIIIDIAAIKYQLDSQLDNNKYYYQLCSPHYYSLHYIVYNIIHQIKFQILGAELIKSSLVETQSGTQSCVYYLITSLSLSSDSHCHPQHKR